MEEFFEMGTLPEEHVISGLDEEMREMRIFPVLCMSGLHDIGSDWLLNLIVEAFPSPADRPAAKVTLNGKESERKCDDKQPAAAFVFKTTADPFAGRLTFFRVLSGVIKNDAHLFVSGKGTEERPGAHRCARRAKL